MNQLRSKLSRRNLLAGAGTAGAVVAATTLLPSVQDAVQLPEVMKEPPVRGGGYQLSEHVKQYYKTTLV